MGAWGHCNFENDTALDCVGYFLESPSLEAVIKPLSAVIGIEDETGYVDDYAAAASLVSAEIIAAANGQSALNFPEKLTVAILKMELKPDDKLVKMAYNGVERVLRESELQELWAEGGEPNEWQQVQMDLLKRLSK